MSEYKNFEDMEVWQDAQGLAVDVYEDFAGFPFAIKSNGPWFRFRTISQKALSARRRRIFRDFSILRKVHQVKFAACIA
jgi:hypothetical protein